MFLLPAELLGLKMEFSMFLDFSNFLSFSLPMRGSALDSVDELVSSFSSQKPRSSKFFEAIS